MPVYLRLVILPVIVWCTLAVSAHSATPGVLVTMKPVHSLVDGLLDGIAEPQLLIDGYQSPHTFQLRPSDVNKIRQADIIIWIGPGMETALQRIINNQTSKLIIRLAEEEHPHTHLHGDQHRWLDPVMALHDARHISQLLRHHLPAHADTIEQNLAHLSNRLKRLDRDIRARFSGPQTVSALLYHDAWSRFLRRYQLRTHGVINPNAQTQPGTRHLYEIGKIIREQQTRCLLVEPQFRPDYIESLQKEHQLRNVVLDPLASELPAGPDAYFVMMRHIADAFVQCL